MAYTTSDTFCASGFGNASFDGSYVYVDDQGGHHFYTNGTYWMFSPGNSETGYGQMTAFHDDAHGQAYGNAGAGLVGTWTMDGGTGGVNPPGVTITGLCPTPPSPATTTMVTVDMTQFNMFGAYFLALCAAVFIFMVLKRK